MKESFVFCPKTGGMEIVHLEPEGQEEVGNRIVSCSGNNESGHCDLACTRFWINRHLLRELNHRLEFKPFSAR